MEPLAENFNQIFKDLLELGFNKNFIDKALQLTNDKEKAVELILKFQEEEEECEIAKALQFSKNESLSHTNQNLIPIVTTNINSNSPNAQNISQNQLIDKEKENEEDWYFQKNDYKLVILVRTDLKMGVGKIAAQVGHAGFKNNMIKSKIYILFKFWGLIKMSSLRKNQRI